MSATRQIKRKSKNRRKESRLLTASDCKGGDFYITIYKNKKIPQNLKGEQL
jgi:hypothetical protein